MGRRRKWKPRSRVPYPEYLPSNGTLSEIDSIANNLITIIPPGANTSITLEAYVNSGRIYLASQQIKLFMDSFNRLVEPSPVSVSDPSYGVNWGIIEFV
jgi:hypothetical protein